MDNNRLAELNEMRQKIDEAREKFKFIATSRPCDTNHDKDKYDGDLALCKVYAGQMVKSCNAFGNNKILVEFDEEMQLAVLNILDERLKKLENEFQHL